MRGIWCRGLSQYTSPRPDQPIKFNDQVAKRQKCPPPQRANAVKADMSRCAKLDLTAAGGTLRNFVQCDGERPACGKCRALNRECPGYNDGFKFVHEGFKSHRSRGKRWRSGPIESSQMVRRDPIAFRCHLSQILTDVAAWAIRTTRLGCWPSRLRVWNIKPASQGSRMADCERYSDSIAGCHWHAP
jgi:hypothetical protein